MAGLTIRNLKKAYGRHVVLDSLDLDVRDGECFVMVGPSGCGKTVLVRQIAGFESPDSGEIAIGGRTVSDAGHQVHVPVEKRRLSMVFQDYAVWPHMTVAANVRYPLKIERVAAQEAERRTASAIKQVGLGGLEERFPAQLSGGQQQRVALARALVTQPGLMLLDEPLSNLDANLREAMRFEIKDLQRRNAITVIYVTHDQEIAFALADRIGVMDARGHLRQIGAPTEVYEQPADRFVFEFLGLSNFIPVERRDGQFYIQGTNQPLGTRLTQGAPRTATMSKLVAACRPSEIDIVAPADGIPATIKRRTFLGPIFDYRLDIGGTEVRVHQDTGEALSKGWTARDGDLCGVRFAMLRWYPA